MQFELDPLIAEAKRRMRRRRVLIGSAFLVFALSVAGVAAALTSLGPGGSPPQSAIGVATAHGSREAGRRNGQRLAAAEAAHAAQRAMQLRLAEAAAAQAAQRAMQLRLAEAAAAAARRHELQIEERAVAEASLRAKAAAQAAALAKQRTH